MQGTTTLASRRKYRTPSGQLSRAGQDREFPPAQVMRLRTAALAGLRSPEWGSELGRLFLESTITAAMYAAGRRWAEEAKGYQDAIGAVSARSGTLQRGALGHPPDPDSEEGRLVVARESKQAQKFLRARIALVGAGAPVESIVRRCCEDNEAVIGMEELSKLRTGLMRLASHWNLTTDGKSLPQKA